MVLKFLIKTENTEILYKNCAEGKNFNTPQALQKHCCL